MRYFGWQFNLDPLYTANGPSGDDSFIGSHDAPYNNNNGDDNPTAGLTDDEIATVDDWQTANANIISQFQITQQAVIANLRTQVDVLAVQRSKAAIAVTDDKVNLSIATPAEYPAALAQLEKDTAIYNQIDDAYATVYDEYIAAGTATPPDLQPFPEVGQSISGFTYSAISINDDDWSYQQ